MSTGDPTEHAFAPIEGPLLRCLQPPHYRVVSIERSALHSEIVEVPL